MKKMMPHFRTQKAAKQATRLVRKAGGFRVVRRGRFIYPYHFANIINEDYDYETCDVLLQLAVFGEIVFG